MSTTRGQRKAKKLATKLAKEISSFSQAHGNISEQIDGVFKQYVALLDEGEDPELVEKSFGEQMFKEAASMVQVFNYLAVLYSLQCQRIQLFERCAYEQFGVLNLKCLKYNPLEYFDPVNPITEQFNNVPIPKELIKDIFAIN